MTGSLKDPIMSAIDDMKHAQSLLKVSQVAHELKVPLAQARHLLQDYFAEHADSLTAFYLESSGTLGSQQDSRCLKVSMKFPSNVNMMDVDNGDDGRMLYAVSSSVHMDQKQGLLCGMAECPVDKFINSNYLRPINPDFQYSVDSLASGDSAKSLQSKSNSTTSISTLGRTSSTTSATSAGGKKKRAVSRKRVYKDHTGRMVTETVVEYETCSESEEPPSRQGSSSSSVTSKTTAGQGDKKLKHTNSNSSSAGTSGSAMSKKPSTANTAGKMKQKSLLSFFGAAPPAKKK